MQQMSQAQMNALAIQQQGGWGSAAVDPRPQWQSMLTSVNATLLPRGANPLDPLVELFRLDRPSLEAEERAFALLVEAIGSREAHLVKEGGAYPIPSQRYPGQEYLVPRQGRIKVMREGRCIQESCLVATGGLPWPDAVLTLIRAIQADETVVFGTGNLTNVDRPS